MSDFGSLFENCGKFYKPGLKPTGDPLDPIGNNNDPTPGIPPGRLPLVKPVVPTGEQLWKCVEIQTIPCPPNFIPGIKEIVKQCQPCVDSNGNPLISTISSPAGYPECKFFSKSECEPQCSNLQFSCTPIERSRYKCVEQSVMCPPGTRSDNPLGPQIQYLKRTCLPCVDSEPDFICKYRDSDCRSSNIIGAGGTVSQDSFCIDDAIYPCFPSDPPGGGGGGGSTSVGGRPGFRCVTEKIYCPPGTARAGSFFGVKSRKCEPCFTGNPPPVGPSKEGSFFPAVPNQNGSGFIKPDILNPSEKVEYGDCRPPPNLELCRSTCPSAATITGDIVAFCTSDPVPQIPSLEPQVPGRIQPVPTNGLTIPSPSFSIKASPTELLNIQEKNAKVIDVNDKLIKEDLPELSQLKTPRKVYDSNLNFFEVEPDTKVRLTSNQKYVGVLKSQVDASVSRAMYVANTNLTWSERDLANLTDEKIEASLSDELLTAFKILRYPGGEVVGYRNFLQMIRKHILTGTLDKVDHLFYINTAKSQLQQNFTLLGDAKNSEYASRYSIDYIVSNGQKIGGSKGSEFKESQGGRVRSLNEDLGITFNIAMEDGSVQKVDLPNEGLPLSTVGAVAATTPESVGSPDHLNIGDGGGYYISVSSTSGEIPLTTDTLAGKSYYLPDFKKAKVLSLNGKSLQSTIIASSLSNQHEFVSGDAGASSFEPMYFGINLDSVSSTYTDDPFIESYKATYSRITNEDQIARHVNNNALSLATYRIGYDDPLYRYILDTSSFTLEQQDFTTYGFKDSLSSINFNFVKNIPFAIVIVPAAGSKFNPLNVQSTLINYKESKLVRSLNFKPSMSNAIDGSQPKDLRRYNLYNEDGSTRIGLVEKENVHSIGYKYNPADYANTLYDGTKYTSSIDAVSSFGVAYLMTEVLDFIASSSDSNTLTWFDVFRRMPFSKFAELSYTAPQGIFEDIKNGLRNNLKFDYVIKGLGKQDSIVLPDDEKTIITIEDRDKLPKDPVDVVSDSDQLPTDEF